MILSRRLRFWFDRNRERERERVRGILERERCHARLSGIVSRVARFTRVFHMGRRAAGTAVRWLSGFRSVTYVRQCTLQSATSPRDPVLQWFPANRVWYRAFCISVYLSNLFVLDLSWILILLFLEIYRKAYYLSVSMIFTRWKKFSRVLLSFFFLFFFFCEKIFSILENFTFKVIQCGWREWAHVIIKIIKILDGNFHIRDVKE